MIFLSLVCLIVRSFAWLVELERAAAKSIQRANLWLQFESSLAARSRRLARIGVPSFTMYPRQSDRAESMRVGSRVKEEEPICSFSNDITDRTDGRPRWLSLRKRSLGIDIELDDEYGTRASTLLG